MRIKSNKIQRFDCESEKFTWKLYHCINNQKNKPFQYPIPIVILSRSVAMSIAVRVSK